MKRAWGKFKTAWWHFWGIDENDDDSIQHLSRSDKISIWYGSFIMCTATVSICLLFMGINNILISRQNNKDMENALNMIAAYLATATEDEYEEIAQTIRHDLVFSEYGRDMENLIEYIPNTAEHCPTCLKSHPAQAYLVSTNTGGLYSLDIFEKGDDPDSERGGMILNFGYDEISEASIHVSKYPGQKDGYAEIYRGRRIVSAQKMKAVFCDDCIRQILTVIEGQLVLEVVIFDADKKAFYPVVDGEAVKIGDYELQTAYDNGNHKIDIGYVGE